MCGFFQVIERYKTIDKSKFLKSLKTMEHRGPDATGHHFKELTIHGQTYSCAFGHQRLSIIDLDSRANQPFFEEKNILLYNGEVYNFGRIKQQYEEQGYHYHTHSDTEVIAKSFSLENFNDLHKFNGMWALSFFNDKQKNIFLSRDRYGKKPLFYYMDEETLCISSTIKAIKSYLNLSLEYHKEHLINYLLFGDMWPTDTQATHFKGINQVLPGHNAYIDLASWHMKEEKYFDSWEQFNKKDNDYSEENLVDKLRQSVELRLVSDRPIALFLSGGIDSSLILSILHHQGHANKINIFMGDTGRSDDYKYAKKCVDQLGVKADTIVSDYSTNAFEGFLNICKNHEKPFPFNGNAIAMSQLYQEVSKRDIPVVLDGSGGDEIFGGYWQRHTPFALNEVDRKQKNLAWKKTILKYNPKNRAVSEYKTYITPPTALKEFFNPFLKVPLKTLRTASSRDPLQNRALDFDDALYKDIAPGGRLGEWIWHNDRNSMMHSIESRSPFLDYKLSPFMYSGYQRKFKEDWNKHELREVFDKFTPLPTQWRKEKQGFRWDGKHFFYNNKDAIVEIIEKSEILKEYMNKDLFSFAGKKFPKIFKSSVSKRFLGIAGIEYMMNQA